MGEGSAEAYKAAREFVESNLLRHPGGRTIVELLGRAQRGGVSLQMVKRVLHDQESLGMVYRDWERRYKRK